MVQLNTKESYGNIVWVKRYGNKCTDRYLVHLFVYRSCYSLYACAWQHRPLRRGHWSKKKDCNENPIVCTRQNLKPGYFDRRHLGENTLRATALDPRSEDNESKTYKLLAETPCRYPNHRSFIDIFFTTWGLTAKCSHQDGRRFLTSKMEHP